jgi:hypothetical protein
MTTARGADWRHQAWLAVLVIAISGFSLVFACAAPFAAFGALAAMTLSRGDAIRTTAALWLANQLIGFALLGYPRTANSFAWGLAIGAAAVLATLAAQWVVASLQIGGLGRAIAAFAAAFAVYEVAIFGAAIAGLGGLGSFAVPIMRQVLITNVVAVVGLYALYRVGAAVGLARPSPVAVTAPARPAAL